MTGYIEWWLGSGCVSELVAWLQAALFLKEINAFFIGPKEDRPPKRGTAIGGKGELRNARIGDETALPPPEPY